MSEQSGFTLTPAEFRERWANNLPKYKQGKGRLARYNEAGEPEVCCLGGGCEEYIAAGGSLARIVDQFGGVTYGGEVHPLPRRVREALGLATASGGLAEPVIEDDRAYLELTLVNDDTDLTFEDIAALVREGRVELAEDAT